MTSEFDLQVLPLYRQAGRDQLDLPGLSVSTAPRRPARGRKQDRLVLFLLFEKGLPFPKQRLDQLLETMQKVYYETSGSVTTAMRTLVEDLNKLILNHNLKQSDTADQVVAYLTIAVVRGDHIYLAQSGASHGFLLVGSQVEHLHDPETAGRGLGVSRTPSVRFFQSPLADGLVLVLTPTVPSGWQATTLQGAFGQPLKSLHRRFLSPAGDDLTALVLQARSGSGIIQQIRSAGALEEPQPAPAEAPKSDAQQGRPLRRPTPQQTPASSPEVEQNGWTQLEAPEEDIPPQSLQAHAAPTDPAEAPPETEAASSARPRRQRRQPPAFIPVVTNALQAAVGFLGRATKDLRGLVGRALPTEDLLNIPTSFMAVTAVVVPLVVVTVAALVYTQIGKVQQYQYYYDQAQSQAQIGQTEEDLDAKYTAWSNTITYLDLAEQYEVSDESQTLRAQAVTILDGMEGVIRLDFKEALAGTLAGNIKIRRMVATSRDLYMLDITSGSVIRASLTGTHYEMDPGFRCGPGPIGSIIVGGLVDMAALPPGNEAQAAIVAMDANGNLLYCFADQPPLAVPLVAPDSAWGNPVAITVENGNLYVLDPLTNALWFYQGQDYQYREAPFFYFVDEVPTLTGAIDLGVDRDSAYLLFNDGRTTTCTYSTLAEAPTFCDQPATYTDSRPGREGGETIDGIIFFQLLHTQPPEPSLYYLDPVNRAIYQFSLRLNLVTQYRPQIDLIEGPATAFAISPTRSIFLAQNNVVYIAFLP